jgi:hypothetical protein
MTIREELTVRFLRWATNGHCAGAIADECLRQMRYAAYQWAEDTYPGSGENMAPDDYDPYRRFPDQRP